MDTTGNMIRFSPTGTVWWAVPNDSPKIATADGGVIGSSGITYDHNGRATGQIPNPAIQSWMGNSYQYGSVDQVVFSPLSVAASFWAFAQANPSSTNTAAVKYEPPQAGLQTIAQSNLTAQSACNTFLNNLTTIAVANGRDPGGPGFTKATLVDEIKNTANSAESYISDGPSSNTLWQQCMTPGCVAMFPVWFTGFQEPPGYQVKQIFEEYSTAPRMEGLSQYNGYTIWLRVISDWSGAWRGLTSQYIHTSSLSKGGQVNSYGLGTLLHEVLHKRSVGGGFTHADMSNALGIESCGDDGKGNNACSAAIANKCFPNN
jgi:hypothetical protein